VTIWHATCASTILNYLFFTDNVVWLCHARSEEKESMEHETRQEEFASALKLLVYSYSQGDLTFLVLTRCARRSMSRISERGVFNRDVSIGPTWRLGKLTSSMRKFILLRSRCSSVISITFRETCCVISNINTLYIC